MSHAEITQLADENKVVINPANAESQTNQEVMLAQLVSHLLLVLGTTSWGSNGNNRLSVDVGTLYGAYPYQATIGAVSTVTTLNNQLLQGNVSSFLTAQYLSDLYTYNYLQNITFS